jgi:fucose permease
VIPRRSRWLVPLAFLAFVSLGLPDGILGVAWPSLRRSFGLPLDRLGVLLVAITAGYLASSFSSGVAVARLGVGRLLLWSSVAVAGGAFTWSVAPFWPLVVGGAALSGLGAGAIDAGINAFAATHFAPRIVSWLHASWGLGAMLGPLLVTAAITTGLGWRGGYALLGACLLAMAVAFRATLGLWSEPTAAAGAAAAVPSPPPLPAPDAGWRGLRETLARPRVRTNVLLFFLYTGVEGSAGQWAMSLLTEARGVEPGLAGVTVAGYWGSLFAGRLAFGAAAHHVAPLKLLRLSLAAAPLAALLVAASDRALAGGVGLLALGFLLAPVFPLLIAETPDRVGAAHAAHAIGFQVSAATLGAGILPAAAGLLLRRAGLEALGPLLLAGTLAVLVVHEWALGRGAGPRSPL